MKGKSRDELRSKAMQQRSITQKAPGSGTISSRILISCILPSIMRMKVEVCGGPGGSDGFFGFLSGKIARGSRGGGNVKIGFIDFQGLVGRTGNDCIVFPRFPQDRHFQDFPHNFSGWPNESQFQLCVRG